MKTTPINAWPVAEATDPVKQYPAAVDDPFKASLDTRVVPRFADAAERTSKIPTPVVNQISMLGTAPGGVDYWTGSAWLPVGARPLKAVAPSWGTVGTTEASLGSVTDAAWNLPSGSLVRATLTGVRFDSTAQPTTFTMRVRTDTVSGSVLSTAAYYWPTSGGHAAYPSFVFVFRTTAASQLNILTGIASANTVTSAFTGALLTVERLTG